MSIYGYKYTLIYISTCNLYTLMTYCTCLMLYVQNVHVNAYLCTYKIKCVCHGMSVCPYSCMPLIMNVWLFPCVPVCLSVCLLPVRRLSVCLSVPPSVRPSVCLCLSVSVCVCLCLSVCMHACNMHVGCIHGSSASLKSFASILCH